jgi:fructuronate reductase
MRSTRWSRRACSLNTAASPTSGDRPTAGPRPPLERVGVQFTTDVAGWENAKLRLLNGAHSALAYLGALAGHPFVHVAMAAPGYRELVQAIWEEAGATLGPLEGFDRAEYCAALTARFNNPALQHKTHQIAMDGSQKLPQRFLNTIRVRRAAGLAHPTLSLAVAGWIRWQFARDDTGETYTVDDPLAGVTGAIIARHKGAVRPVTEDILRLEQVFGTDLPSAAHFVAEISGLVEALVRRLSGSNAAAGAVSFGTEGRSTSVRVTPGQKVLTVMFQPPSSRAMARVMPITADLDVM